MLFLADSDFIDVVKEEQFNDVVTVSASSPLALAKFKHHSEGKIIVNADNFAFPFIAHHTRLSGLPTEVQQGVLCRKGRELFTRAGGFLLSRL